MKKQFLAILAVVVSVFVSLPAVAGDKDTVKKMTEPVLFVYACDTEKELWVDQARRLAVGNLAAGKLSTEAPAFVGGLSAKLEAKGYRVIVAKDCHVTAGPAIIAGFKTSGVSMDEGVILVQAFRMVGRSNVVPVRNGGDFFVAGPDGGAKEAGERVALAFLSTQKR